MATRDLPKKLGLFYVVLLTVPEYIICKQFITTQVLIQTQYCWSNIKYYIGFKNITSEQLEYCDFVYPQGRSWRSNYETKKQFGISIN